MYIKAYTCIYLFKLKCANTEHADTEKAVRSVDRSKVRSIDRYVGRPTDRKTDRQADRPDRQADRQAGRRTDMDRHRQTARYLCGQIRSRCIH